MIIIYDLDEITDTELFQTIFQNYSKPYKELKRFKCVTNKITFPVVLPS